MPISSAPSDCAIHCLISPARQVINSPGWADETVDCTVRWNRLNRHFNIIYLAGWNLWNRHRLECAFNQLAYRIRPTRCIIIFNHLFTEKITCSKRIGMTCSKCFSAQHIQQEASSLSILDVSENTGTKLYRIYRSRKCTYSTP